ncbi:MAG: MATE family efflux transporter [Ruminococcaceae bacterium]|nr:MATE family efflux transporter [Oscillospiraceae bacterium]
MKMKTRISDKAFYKAFFTMTITMALQNLIVFGVNLADSVMMGAYSETALSGIGICNNIQFFLNMAASGIASGMTVIASQYWGKNEKKPIFRVSAVAMWISIIFTMLIFAFAALAPDTLIRLFTDKDAVIEQAVLYLDVIKHTYLLFTLSTILLAILRSVETVKIGFYVSLSSFAINILLNYMLIYGKFGAPEMGIRGAAVATLVSRAIELAVVIIYILFIDKKLQIKIKDLFAADMRMFKDYFKTGLPLMMSSVSWGIAMSIQGAIIGRLVESAIAANSIATTLFQVATVICYASSNVACVLIGKTIGENKPMEVIKSRSKNLQLIFLAIGITSSAILLIFKNLIIDFYNATPQTVEITNQFIWVLCVTIIGTAYEAPCLCGIVSGGGETSFVLKNDIIFMWLIVLPLSALSAFVFKFPVVVTFACLKADQVLKCAVAVVKVNRFNWVKSVTRDKIAQ